MTPAPERSLEQRVDALARANAIRSARAELKRRLKRDTTLKLALQALDGLDEELELIRVDGAPPPANYLHSMKAYDLLIALPGFGRVKANKVLARNAVSPSKTLAGLSTRQRLMIRAELELVARARATAGRIGRFTTTPTERAA